MHYLISGHVRTRSAWMCAVMNAHGSRCYHDVVSNGIPLDIRAGISDPGIANIRPLEGVTHCKGARLCLVRDNWREPFERWSGVPLTDNQVEQYNLNVETYSRTLGTIMVPYEQLDDVDVVTELVEICIQRPGSREIVQIFEQLTINQNIPKAQYAYAHSQSPAPVPPSILGDAISGTSTK